MLRARRRPFHSAASYCGWGPQPLAMLIAIQSICGCESAAPFAEPVIVEQQGGPTQELDEEVLTRPDEKRETSACTILGLSFSQMLSENTRQLREPRAEDGTEQLCSPCVVEPDSEAKGGSVTVYLDTHSIGVGGVDVPRLEVTGFLKGDGSTSTTMVYESFTFRPREGMDRIIAAAVDVSAFAEIFTTTLSWIPGGPKASDQDTVQNAMAGCKCCEEYCWFDSNGVEQCICEAPVPGWATCP
jgi:hypothetical protein